MRHLILAFILLPIMISCNQETMKKKEYFTVQGNPLFNKFNEQIDFQSIKPNDITEAADTIIWHSNKILDEITQVKDVARTFNNTMLKLDDLSADLGRIGSEIYLYLSVHPDSAIRNSADEANKKLNAFGNEISLNENLYAAVKSYSNSDEAKNLTGYKKKYLKETVDGFERNGFALNEAGRDELKIIKDSINNLSSLFSKNISEYKDYLIVSEYDLDGLSENFKKQRLQDDGTYKIDLSYPSFLPMMKFCKSDKIREELYMKYNNRAADTNLEVLQNLLKQREKMVNLLGYNTYSEWRLEERMAKNPATVWEFENNLIKSVKPKADMDYQELIEIKKSLEYLDSPETIKPWESSFVKNVLLEEKYKLSEDEIKQYFSMDASLDGVFAITQSIFNVTYKEIENPSVWNDDVRAFEVWDGDKLIGRFYLDLFPRDNKYGHAACFGIIKGKMTDQGYQIPNAALVCNFPKATDDTPSLLPHRQVETLFHEFGHVLHQMLTEAELYSFSGTSVARDFVEAPSQIFENWAWDYASLKLFAKHYETGEVLPKSLYGSMLAAKNVGSGLSAQGQISYALLDLTLHDKYDPNGEVTTDDVYKEVKERVTHFPFVEGTHKQASFGHLTGYGSSYYGYMWALVIADDMFSVFDENGLLDQETGMRYRKIILARGGSEEPDELVKEFLGREPNNEAFKKALGI